MRTEISSRRTEMNKMTGLVEIHEREEWND